MRVIFFGTPNFAVPSLEQLLESSHEVMAVVPHPDRPKGRSSRPASPPVKEAARNADLPILQPDRLGEEGFLKAIAAFKPEIAAVVAYGRLLPSSLLKLFPRGAVNVHPSLLPKLRGAAPIQWSLSLGEAETSVTVFQLDEQMDRGPILLQVRHPIRFEDTAVTLNDLLAALGGRILMETLDMIESGSVHLHPQDDSHATPAPPLKKEDGVIRWEEDCHAIHNRIRGVQPWPGAISWLDGQMLKIILAVPEISRHDGRLPPGTVISADLKNGLWVQTGRGQLRIDQLQLEGGKILDASTFLRGHPIPPGTRLVGPKTV